MYVGCMHILYCYVENQTQNLDLNNIFYFCLEYKQVLWYTIHDDFLSFLHVHIGTDQFLTEHPRLIQQCIQSDQPEQPSPCKKDTGQRSRLRHWSRGHVFVCRPCGHIDFSQPIYKLVHYILSCTDIRNVIVSVLNCGYRSESPTQVFVILLHWLFENLSSIPEDQWSEVIIAYDNMCQLDSLQIAKNPLPLPSPFDKMWMAVRKVRHMLPDNDI